MSNQQFYLAVAVPSAVALMGFLTTLAGFLIQNKRLDDMRDDMKGMRLTLEAIRQDLSDFRAKLSAHEVEISHLKQDGK